MYLSPRPQSTVGDESSLRQQTRNSEPIDRRGGSRTGMGYGYALDVPWLLGQPRAVYLNAGIVILATKTIHGLLEAEELISLRSAPFKI